MAHEFTLPLFNSKLAGLHPRQNLMQMGQMLMHCATKHYNVIHIHMCKSFHANKLLIHKTFECARCIGKPEGHDIKAKQTSFAVKCCPVLVLWVHFNLMIALL